MPRTNAFAQVRSLAETRDSGQRSGLGVPGILYDGPAHVTAPSKDWQQVAALEGQLSAQIHVETAADLASAREVEIRKSHRGALDGTYEVLSTVQTGDRRTLALSRRSVRYAS